MPFKKGGATAGRDSAGEAAGKKISSSLEITLNTLKQNARRNQHEINMAFRKGNKHGKGGKRKGSGPRSAPESAK